MPIVEKKIYEDLLAKAKQERYALPAINVASMVSVNAALKGFEMSKSDGIIQVSTGGGKFASGASIGDMALGAKALAEYVHSVADRYDCYIVLHTDHCLHHQLDAFVRPLLEETKTRRREKKPNLFSSHMFDGSTLPIEENLELSEKLLAEFAENDMLLEIEIGAVGGEEDGVKAEKNANLYTTDQDMMMVADKLGLGEKGNYILAATFGNVHGVYKPGQVQLRPEILKSGQEAVAKKYKIEKPFYLVFHGGSGSELEKIHESLDYGVIKMNVDTDTQYAFTRPIVDHMFENYQSVMKVDGDVGNKKYYDPRAYLKKAEISMAERVKLACENLRSAGKTIFKKKQ